MDEIQKLKAHIQDLQDKLDIAVAALAAIALCPDKANMIEITILAREAVAELAPVCFMSPSDALNTQAFQDRVNIRGTIS